MRGHTASPNRGSMHYMTTIEERDGVVHVEVRARGASDGEPVALFACSSLATAVGPLQELLRVAVHSAARASDPTRCRRA